MDSTRAIHSKKRRSKSNKHVSTRSIRSRKHDDNSSPLIRHLQSRADDDEVFEMLGILLIDETWTHVSPLKLKLLAGAQVSCIVDDYGNQNNLENILTTKPIPTYSQTIAQKDYIAIRGKDFCLLVNGQSRDDVFYLADKDTEAFLFFWNASLIKPIMDYYQCHKRLHLIQRVCEDDNLSLSPYLHFHLDMATIAYDFVRRSNYCEEMSRPLCTEKMAPLEVQFKKLPNIQNKLQWLCKDTIQGCDIHWEMFDGDDKKEAEEEKQTEQGFKIVKLQKYSLFNKLHIQVCNEIVYIMDNNSETVEEILIRGLQYAPLKPSIEAVLKNRGPLKVTCGDDHETDHGDNFSLNRDRMFAILKNAIILEEVQLYDLIIDFVNFPSLRDSLKTISTPVHLDMRKQLNTFDFYIAYKTETANLNSDMMWVDVENYHNRPFLDIMTTDLQSKLVSENCGYYAYLSTSRVRAKNVPYLNAAVYDFIPNDFPSLDDLREWLLEKTAVTDTKMYAATVVIYKLYPACNPPKDITFDSVADFVLWKSLVPFIHSQAKEPNFKSSKRALRHQGFINGDGCDRILLVLEPRSVPFYKVKFDQLDKLVLFYQATYRQNSSFSQDLIEYLRSYAEVLHAAGHYNNCKIEPPYTADIHRMKRTNNALQPRMHWPSMLENSSFLSSLAMKTHVNVSWYDHGQKSEDVSEKYKSHMILAKEHSPQLCPYGCPVVFQVLPIRIMVDFSLNIREVLCYTPQKMFTLFDSLRPSFPELDAILSWCSTLYDVRTVFTLPKRLMPMGLLLVSLRGSMRRELCMIVSCPSLRLGEVQCKKFTADDVVHHSKTNIDRSEFLIPFNMESAFEALDKHIPTSFVQVETDTFHVLDLLQAAMCGLHIVQTTNTQDEAADVVLLEEVEQDIFN